MEGGLNLREVLSSFVVELGQSTIKPGFTGDVLRMLNSCVTCMGRPSPRLIRIGVIIASPFLLLAGCLLVEQIPMSAARPPKSLKTIEEFKAWKTGSIKGSGTFHHDGAAYTVMLGPAGRHFPSGPAAYVFDEQGQFVDWTADMGDFPTVKKGFSLNTGGFVRTKPESP